MSCKCQDCGKQFKMDLIVDDLVWDKIRPTGSSGDGGLLCPSCIVTKVEKQLEYCCFRLVEIE